MSPDDTSPETSNAAIERDLACPRCRYNLRGLITPRCPECGLEFDQQDARAGFIREHIATKLDRIDLWQPHRVLLETLLQLLRTIARPGRLVRTLDLNGPTAPAFVMLIVGIGWIYLLCGSAAAIAINLKFGASPFASAKCGFLLWAPALLATYVPLSLAATLFTCQSWIIGTAGLTVRQVIRLMGYLAPVMIVWTTVPVLLSLLLAPEFISVLGKLGAASIIVPVVQITWPPIRAARVSKPAIGESLCDLLAVAALVLTFHFAPLLLPSSLEPPIWIFI